MKNFVKQNWYKLMVGSSLLMASFGFMVYSITSAHAEESHLKENAAFYNSNSSSAENSYWVAYNGYAYRIKESYYDFDPMRVVSKIKLEVGAKEQK